MQQLQPSPDLLNRIVKKINYERELQRLKLKLFFYCLFLVLSLGLFATVLAVFWAQLSQSGFFEMLKLGVTDFKSISTNFSDYALSLAETLPVLSVAFISALFLAVMLGIYKFTNYAFKIKHLRIN